MNQQDTLSQRSLNQYAYRLILFMLALTGFAQMPIFSRYYIADIPGLGWLGEFYITHFMHYLFAIALLGMAAYKTTDYILQKRHDFQITLSGYVRAGIITALIVTGGLLVIRNLTGSGFSHQFIIVLNMAHLILVLALFITGGLCLALNKNWIKFRH